MPIPQAAHKSNFNTRSKAAFRFVPGINGIHDEEDSPFHHCAYPVSFSP